MPTPPPTVLTAELGTVTIGPLVTSEGSFRFVYQAETAHDNRELLIEARNLVGADQNVRRRVAKELQVIRAIKRSPNSNVMPVHFVQTTLLSSFVFYGTDPSMHNITMYGAMPPRTARGFVRQICNGLDHIHTALGFIHRDLVPENVKINAAGRVELSNFTQATLASDDTRTIAGHLEYIAPEVLLGQEQTKAVDFWSLGVLVCEMCVLAREPTLFHFSPYDLSFMHARPCARLCAQPRQLDALQRHGRAGGGVRRLDSSGPDRAADRREHWSKRGGLHPSPARAQPNAPARDSRYRPGPHPRLLRRRGPGSRRLSQRQIRVSFLSSGVLCSVLGEGVAGLQALQ